MIVWISGCLAEGLKGSSRVNCFLPAAWPRTLGFCLLLASALTGACGLRLSEMLALNDGGLRDADHETPDWIELCNDSDQAVALSGWHLTDTAGFPTRWTFPNTNLAAHACLLVFASGKDRAVAGAELHANFRLDPDGGYLALVAPDGVTVAHALNYPAQRANVSYGAGRLATTNTLVSVTAPMRWWVPTNGSLGTAWTQAVFDDSAWATGTNGLGFDTGSTNAAGTVLLAFDVNERGTTPVTQSGFLSFVINSNVSSTTIQTNPTVRSFGGYTVTLAHTAPYGYDDRVRTTPTNSGAFTLSSLLRDHVMGRDLTSTGGLDWTVAGFAANQQLQVSVWSFDSGSANPRISDWYANGQLVRSKYTFDGSVLPTTDDQYRFDFTTTSTTGGVVVVQGRRSLSSLANNPAVQVNGMRFTQLGYAGLIATDARTAMSGRNSSAYVRLPFTVSDPASAVQWSLRVQYDDGFVAYINGRLVAARNAPAPPAWNSAAFATHSGTEYEVIPLSLPADTLVAGTNVLAIQGLNSASGDADFLLRAELTGVSAIELPGRFFQPSSPGLPNGTGYLGWVETPQFSVERGFYETPFSLSLTCLTAGAQVRFTTNGSMPSLTNGAVFTAPIPINGLSFVRAAAFLTGWVPSESATHSYLFLRDVLRQSNSLAGYPTVWQASYPADYEMDTNVIRHPRYGLTLSNDLRALPVLSIVTEHDGLWGDTRGIYNHATSLHDPTTGQDWERAASVELIQPDSPTGNTEFAVNCALRMEGNASRDNVRTPKHSFRLLFKGDYGVPKLRYPWFPGPVTEFDNVVLRAAGFTDGWPTRYSDTTLYTNAATGEVFRGGRYRPENSTFLRDVFLKDAHRAMGWLASRSTWVELYVNGLFWGIYNPSERLDASYLANHIGGWEEDWDVLVGDDSLFVAMPSDGTKDAWNAMMAVVNAGVTSESAYQSVSALVDVDNLIDYMLVHFFVEAEDWPHHNFYCTRRKANSTNGLPATRWQFLAWDQEISLDRMVRRDRTGVNNADTPAAIYAQLRNWPEFRLRFADRAQKHLFNDGALTASQNVARFAARAAVITNALVAESARWGDAREFTIGANPGTGITFTRDEWWVPELHKLWTNFIPSLNGTCVSRLRAAGLYPAIAAPDFSQFGGDVPAGFVLTLSHTNASGTIYYTTDGSDPRAYGTGAVAPSALPYANPIVLNATATVRARVLSGGVWSALVEASFRLPQDLSALALTEIMYNPLPNGTVSGDEFEFLELKNTGTNALDLSGLAFSAGVTFTFTNGTQLAPGAFAVLARNAEMFSQRYPDVPLAGLFTGKLDNSGETITLAHPNGARVLSVAYDDDPPWSATADGFGFSLVPRQTGLASSAANGAPWRASARPGGSPGGDDPAPAAEPAVVINEVLSNPGAGQLDAIELFNPGAAATNIGGWYLTDDRALPRKFRLPEPTVLAAGGCVVFNATQFGVGPTAFGLSELGEEVHLFAADSGGNLTGYSHGFAFGAADSGVSFGRCVVSTGEEHFPAQTALSLGGTNVGPRVGPVVLNEVHYHPASGDVEFVELLNLSAAPVPLFDPTTPTNTWRLDGLGYSFPPAVTLAPHGLLLIVATNPAVFRAQYAVAEEVQILGPFAGALQNDGERLTLRRPAGSVAGTVPLITVEEVRYLDQAPWPAAADGTGPSLQRLLASGFGNEPSNWFAAPPTPGRANAELDSDNDGMPDAWEIAHGTDAHSPDNNDDPDGDGFTNLNEYLAGTDPQDAGSVLKLRASVQGDSLELSFDATADHYHQVLGASALSRGGWTLLTNFPAQSLPSHPVVRWPLATNTPPHFYRVMAGRP